MRFWMAYMFEDTTQMLDVARAADEMGFAGIALADHIAVPERFASTHPSGENPFDHRTFFPDPFTSIAAMASVTTRLQFMPYVYILPMRDPFSVAKQAGTAAAFATRRMALGVGVGWLREELELLGFDPATRGRRTDEMIEILRRFWRDGVAEFHGEFYDFGPTGMFPTPGGEVPIWIGGKSATALARAARNDGWLGMNYDLDEIDVLLGALHEARARAADLGVARSGSFETMVIPNVLATHGVYDALESKGVTSTICMPWMPGDAAVATVGAKIDAMRTFADLFLANH